MQEKAACATEELASYLTCRLEGASSQRADRKGTNGRPAVADVRADLKAEEIARLAHEKQDLVRQVIADERFLKGKEESMSQNELLAALEKPDGRGEQDFRALGRFVGSDQGVKSSIDRAKKRLAAIDGEIKELLGDPAVAEAYRLRLCERIAIIRQARNAQGLRRILERMDLARMQLVAHRNGADLTLSAADEQTLSAYDLIGEKAREKIEELMGREPVYYEVKRRNLLEYRRQLLTGGFVRTESFKNQIVRILSHVQLGIPVFLRGHLGVGKTEMALHVSRFCLGCEPEFISGSEEATKYDIYGKTQIGAGSDEERQSEFRKRMEEYQRFHPDGSVKELREVERQYYNAIVVHGQATSFFQYGPLVQAMRQGKPLIIDEMDGIPHSILMRINHVLTRRAGESITVQESAGEEIAVNKGFCVIATGNVKSARYKREELDAAFLSRWWSEDVRYPPPGETYEILLAGLIDRRGSLQVSDTAALDNLRRLTEAAAEIQRIFTGAKTDYLGEGADAARGTPAGLRKTVLSLRHLWNIIKPWKAHNYDKSIDDYILDEFIRPAVAEDQIYLIQLFCRFRFFKEWTIDRFDMPGLTEAKLLAFQGKQAL